MSSTLITTRANNLQKGQSGSVLHIFKYFAFIHSKTRTQDNGVFVVRAKSCKLQGTSKNAQQIGNHNLLSSSTHFLLVLSDQFS